MNKHQYATCPVCKLGKMVPGFSSPPACDRGELCGVEPVAGEQPLGTKRWENVYPTYDGFDDLDFMGYYLP